MAEPDRDASARWIVWRIPLRVAGELPLADAAQRLRAMLRTTRFELSERLVGILDGERVRVWKKGPLSIGADIVQFSGTLRANGTGAQFEGTCEYKLATKIQFVGLLLVGLALSGIGVARFTSGSDPDAGLLKLGAGMFGLALFWCYASHRMRHEQVTFIEKRLHDVVSRTTD